MGQAPATATYTNDPTGTVLDRVRLEIGDTDCATAFLSDAEIQHYLDLEAPSVLRAASRAASAIVAKVARKIDFSHGPVRKNLGQLSDHYVALAAALSRRANLESVAPVVLGVDVAEKQAADEDETRVQPSFKIGQHDNPRSGPTVASQPGESTVI